MLWTERSRNNHKRTWEARKRFWKRQRIDLEKIEKFPNSAAETLRMRFAAAERQTKFQEVRKWGGAVSLRVSFVMFMGNICARPVKLSATQVLETCSLFEGTGRHRSGTT